MFLLSLLMNFSCYDHCSHNIGLNVYVTGGSIFTRLASTNKHYHLVVKFTSCSVFQFLTKMKVLRLGQNPLMLVLFLILAHNVCLLYEGGS